MWENVEKCGKMCENVENVEKCGKMWKNVEKCVKMCENVLETRFLYTTRGVGEINYSLTIVITLKYLANESEAISIAQNCI